ATWPKRASSPNPRRPIGPPAENAGESGAVAKHTGETTPALSVQQNVDPAARLSLTPAAGNAGAAGMIQQVADFLLAQDIIKNKVDAKAAVDGTWVSEYLTARRQAAPPGPAFPPTTT